MIFDTEVTRTWIPIERRVVDVASTLGKSGKTALSEVTPDEIEYKIERPWNDYENTRIIKPECVILKCPDILSTYIRPEVFAPSSLYPRYGIYPIFTTPPVRPYEVEPTWWPGIKID